MNDELVEEYRRVVDIRLQISMYWIYVFIYILNIRITEGMNNSLFGFMIPVVIHYHSMGNYASTCI